jgi:hypothetical protein
VLGRQTAVDRPLIGAGHGVSTTFRNMLCRLCHGARLQREWREGEGDRHRAETDAPDESADSLHGLRSRRDHFLNGGCVPGLHDFHSA